MSVATVPTSALATEQKNALQVYKAMQVNTRTKCQYVIKNGDIV